MSDKPSRNELEKWVKRAQEGNAEAFTWLVDRYQYAVYGAAYAMLANFDDAQDIAQEALILAWRDLPGLRDPQRFPAWLQQITRNRCLDFVRRNRAQRETISIGDVEHALPPSSVGLPVKHAENQETADALQNAIADLSEPNRLATTLFYINGYSIEEVADFLEVPEGTVKRRLHDSRKQLKARMIDMVADTLKKNPLPDDFTRKTVEKSVEEAKGLIAKKEFAEAETKLRDALAKIPDHVDALRELNRAVMSGSVVNAGKWNLLGEVADRGKAIISSGQADEHILSSTVRTLLVIPAISEALELLQHWIDAEGASFERLGMKAWALGSMAHYDEAEEAWNNAGGLSPKTSDQEMDRQLGTACLALVDCFASAGEMDRAARVARSGWDIARTRDIYFPLLLGFQRLATYWPEAFEQAGLDEEAKQVARECLPYINKAFPDSIPYAEARRELGKFNLRVWFDDAQLVITDFLEYAEQHKNIPADLRLPLLWAFFRARRIEGILQLAEATQKVDEKGEKMIWPWWQQMPFPVAYFLHSKGNYDLVERMVQESRKAGIEHDAYWLGDMAILKGEPTPSDIMEEIVGKGPDNARYDAWYHVAREAAAQGDETKAFDALERAAQIWSNPPLHLVNMWEKDKRWGKLLDDARFKKIIEEKRRRIGPIYGQLHYFPKW